jgi:DNA-binding helix-hairpin-helix protein with protein kinase domain
MIQRLVNGAGLEIELGSELGRGGEGAVFELRRDPALVAKVYHTPPSTDKANKLRAMAASCTPRLKAIAAWPVDTVHSADSGGLRGFLMPRVNRQKDIHLLYGPKTRLREYPDATYRFLVHVAANLARAFEVVHLHGHVIGDVNQGGACISEQGTVTLVDCDSFQVSGRQRTFSCDVGIPIYQPPELQDVKSFRGLPRTANHDNFGLAVLLFQTLFLARHPFAGRSLTGAEITIEQAIQDSRFAYSRNALRKQIGQPPGTLGLGVVSGDIAELFEAAFSDPKMNAVRPTAQSWRKALDAFASELLSCTQNPGHAYARTLQGCPLCELEGKAGLLLFLPPRDSLVAAPLHDVEQIWRGLAPVLASIRLGEPPVLPARSVPPASVAEFARRRASAKVVLWVGLATSIVLAMAWHRSALLGGLLAPLIALALRGRVPVEAQNLAKRIAAGQARIDQLVQQFEAARAALSIPDLEARAESLYRRLTEFPHREAERLAALDTARRHRQRQRFLDRFEVGDAGLKGFGPGLYATLVSNGIETADDVDSGKLDSVRGIGPKRKAALLEWRRGVEARFVFNSADPADAQERLRLQQMLRLEHARDSGELRRIADQIASRAVPLRQQQASLVAQLTEARQVLANAKGVALALDRL